MKQKSVQYLPPNPALSTTATGQAVTYIGMQSYLDRTSFPSTYHRDLTPTEVVSLSVGHGDLYVVPGEGWQGRHHRRLQDYNLHHEHEQFAE